MFDKDKNQNRSIDSVLTHVHVLISDQNNKREKYLCTSTFDNKYDNITGMLPKPFTWF